MPKLESIEWTQFLMDSDTIRELQRVPNRLKHFSVQFTSNGALLRLKWSSSDGILPILDGQTIRLGRFTPPTSWVPGLENLQSLTLHNISDQMLPWARCIALVLIRSPRLHTLDLSGDTVWFTRRGCHPDDHRGYLKFVSVLAHEYFALGGHPLSLYTFRCGPLILPSWPRSLYKLVNLSQLEVVQIDNDPTWLEMYRALDRRDIPPWLTLYDWVIHSACNLFLSECPNLRRFLVSEMDQNVWEALKSTDGSHLRRGQVAVSVAALNHRVMSGISDAFVFT